MFSDFTTFITELPGQLMQTGTFLPDSFENGSAYLSAISNFLNALDTSYKIIGSIISLVIALAGCFFGYKLSKLFMALTGFIFGSVAGGTVGVYLLDFSGWKIALCVLIGAIILSFMAYRIYQAGIFLLCFVLSFMAAASFLPFTGDIQFFLSVVIGFIVGSLALKFIRPVIIITSAIVCGTSAAGLLITVCEYMNMSTFASTLSSHSYLLTIVICVLGIAVQFLATPSEHRHEHKHS